MDTNDRAVLVLSDTDYIPAIKKARENFTLVTFYEPHFSDTLKEECDLLALAVLNAICERVITAN